MVLLQEGPWKYGSKWIRRGAKTARLGTTTRAADTVETAILSEWWLLWGVLFGSFGLGFFWYGKKQRAIVPLVCGLILMFFPYFVSSTMLLVAIGIMLIVVPYFVRI